MEQGIQKLGADFKVSKEVITTIVKNAASGVDGVYGLAEAKNKKILGFFASGEPTDAVDINFSGDMVEISLHLFVKRGAKVKSLAEQVQSRIKSEVQSMTGVMVSKVNVTIDDLKE